MKLALPTRYLARAFVDAANAVGKPDDPRLLAERLGSQFSTQLIFEARADGSVRPRPLLVTEDGWQIALLSESFDVARLPTASSEGRNMGWVSDFAAEACKLLVASLDFAGRNGHRLALVDEGLLPERSVAQMDQLRKKLLNTPADFDVPLFEWDWRIARRAALRIGGVDEATNEIAFVKRAPVEYGTPASRVSADRLFGSVDVNTAPDDTRARFTPGLVEEFFSVAAVRHAEISKSVDAHLEVG